MASKCLFTFTNRLILKDVCHHKSLVRTIYRPEVLKIDSYIDMRKMNEIRIPENKKATFLSDIEHQITQPGGQISTMDIKNLIYLGQAENAELLPEVLRSFNRQTLRFSNFTFGPEIMKYLYHSNKPDLALEIIKDQSLRNLFSNFTSYSIAMNLLYKNQRYQEVIDLYHQLATEELGLSKFNKGLIQVVMAACYQMNTPEITDFAKNLTQEFLSSNKEMPLRSVGFYIGLLAKQGHYKEALEYTQKVKIFDPNIANLKMRILVELGQLEEAMDIPHKMIYNQVQDVYKNSLVICQDTVNRLGDCIREQGANEALNRQYDQMVQALKENKMLGSATLDELVSEPIGLSKMLKAFRTLGRPFRYYEQSRKRGLLDEEF